MKTLLSIILAICVFSCKKTGEKQDLTSHSTSQNQSSAIAGKGASRFPLSIWFYAKFVWFNVDCKPSTWYCFTDGGVSDNKSWIEIDEDNQIITFGIDNRDSSVYNSQFMVGTDFQFPQDTLSYAVTHAASGSKDSMYVNAGLYHFEIVDTTIVIKVPYHIIP
ncbi:MAG: hypothetical protein H7Y86_11325 [Rhizobacter sp.]|nr:hypothetical protein [Ferruginibacter sp.]